MTHAPTPEIAISAALAQDWKRAITINTQLLKVNKTDTDALCRLAFAYQNIGKLKLARQLYQKVLKLDAYHQIALKNLKKLTTLKSRDIKSSQNGHALSPTVFIEEPGKTKIVECVHLAPAQILSSLTHGQEVYLKAKNHCVEVRDGQHRYVAALPDDLSFKLLKFLAGGNQYQVVIKGVEKKSLHIFLRETNRGKRFTNQPSFTTTAAYLPKSEIHPKETTNAGDQEEGEAEENEES